MKCDLITPHVPALKRIDEWLTPSFPDWFKQLPNTKDQFDVSRNDFKKNVRGCPSFVRLFKNSYLFRAPEDVMITGPEAGGRIIFASGETQPNFQSVSSSDVAEMMHPSFEETHINLLFTYQFILIADEPMEMVFLDPCYHLDKKSELQTMTGTLQLHPELYMPISLNMLLPKAAFNEKDTMFIRKGQPLAYFFFPGGKPKIEPRKITMEEWTLDHGYQKSSFQGNWIKEMNKLTEENTDAAD